MNYEALGRYHAHRKRFDALAAEQSAALGMLRRWAASADGLRQTLRLLQIDELRALTDAIALRHDEMHQLAQAINSLATDTGEPRIPFAAHQIL